MPRRLGRLLPALFLALAGCVMVVDTRAPGDSVFVTPEMGPKTPWTGRQFLNDAAEFQFAIIADIHGGNRPGVFEDAVDKINLMRPEFVLSVGDLINGYTEDEAQIDSEWDAFEQQVAPLGMRFFFVPGNHDLSNETMTRKWEERYGRSYYHFLYRDVLFLCLNSEDPNRTSMSDQQVQYVAGVLAENTDVRWTFVFMHKPFWYYDDPSGWAKIEETLVNRPHTVLAGHHHRYVKFERNGQSYIQLATTGGGSGIAGSDLGLFDHIVWVTMSHQGPVIANLDLAGILDEDVFTEEVLKIVQMLNGGAWLASDGLISEGRQFTAATTKLRLTNPTPVPITVRVDVQPAGDIQVAPAVIEAEVPAGGEQVVDLTATLPGGGPVAGLAPLVLRATATCTLPDRDPITAQIWPRVDIRGAWQGREMLKNGRFDQGRTGWGIWINEPDAGTAQTLPGKVVVAMADAENSWAAGITHPIGTLRAGGSYRLTFAASCTGAPNEMIIQFKKGGESMELLVDGTPQADHTFTIGEEPATYTLDFTVPGDADTGNVNMVLLLGFLNGAELTTISLREMLAPEPQ